MTSSIVGAGFAIRRAGDADHDGILACLRLAFEPVRTRYSPRAFADTVLTPETLGIRRARMTLFVAVDAGGMVIGTIGAGDPGPRGEHIRGMAVHPAWQGRGVSGALLDAAEAELQRLGCRRISLTTTELLARAMAFYSNHGFVRSGGVRDFFGLVLIEYVKDLSGGAHDAPPQLDKLSLDASRSLAVYGSLAPGRINHHLIAGLIGSWDNGFVRGRLHDAGWGSGIGFPALELNPNGAPVPVHVLRSDQLPAAWGRLDAFEGPEYQRVHAVVTGVATAPFTISQIYAMRDPSSPGQST